MGQTAQLKKSNEPSLATARRVAAGFSIEDVAALGRTTVAEVREYEAGLRAGQALLLDVIYRGIGTLRVAGGAA